MSVLNAQVTGPATVKDIIPSIIYNEVIIELEGHDVQVVHGCASVTYRI
jgi:hypothetical protein